MLPLRRALMNYSAWVTGLRRDQWATRSNIRKVEIDHDHGGIVKLAPLADWTEDEVWDYIRANDVPYNELYDKGYKSIGCAPCTRPVAEGQDARARGDGGGRPARPRNAACIARSKPAASSTSWPLCWAMNMHKDENQHAASAEALKLDELQRDLLSSLIQSFIAAAPESAARDAYVALEDAVAKMEVAPELVPAMGAIVEVALSTGRIRNMFGPAAELALAALFRKTPRGEAIAGSLNELNRALAKLKDQPLGEISAALRKPGVYTLSIASGEYRIVVRFDHDGAAVESVETGGG